MFVWLGAAAIGLSLGLLGGGGSILTVPLLVYGFGVETKTAMATSLLVVAVTSALAAIPYANKGLVCRRVGMIFGLAAMLGAYGGGSAARFIPSEVLLVLFIIMMFGTAVAMLRGSSRAEETVSAHSSPCHMAAALPLGRILLDGLAVGAVTGLIGAGGGFLVVPALHFLGGLPMHAAIGTSVLVIALKSIAGFVAYAQHVAVDYRLAACITLLAAAGTLLGSLMAGHLSAARLKRGFGLFIVCIAFYTLYREAPWELLQHHILLLTGIAVGITVPVTWLALRKRPAGPIGHG